MKITQKIVKQAVKTETTEPNIEVKVQEAQQEVLKELLHEKTKRSEKLNGSTYKINTPQSEHAIYVTINNIVMNEGTEHEEIRPYELFINSKNIEHHQWVFALARVISAVFRKGGEVSFLSKELMETFDPKGGYFKKGKYMPSIVAEIGGIIDEHMASLGLVKRETLTVKQDVIDVVKEQGLKNASFCPSCNAKALIMLDGCKTCAECGYSHCG